MSVVHVHGFEPFEVRHVDELILRQSKRRTPIAVCRKCYFLLMVCVAMYIARCKSTLYSLPCMQCVAQRHGYDRKRKHVVAPQDASTTAAEGDGDMEHLFEYLVTQGASASGWAAA